MHLRPRSRRRLAAALTVPLITLGACGTDEADTSGGDSTSSSSPSESEESGSTEDADFPNVIEAVLSSDGDTYSLEVTMSSEYDTPERYADGWRVLDPEGNELGTMELGHDHASEQPFTRSQSDLEIPDGVETVTIEGHDLENGYGGGAWPRLAGPCGKWR